LFTRAIPQNPPHRHPPTLGLAGIS
jgi:hypothetical protein